MKNDIELKPCPFCGETPTYGSYRNPALGAWYVSCPACHGCGPMEGSKREAEVSWNRRANNGGAK